MREVEFKKDLFTTQIANTHHTECWESEGERSSCTNLFWDSTFQRKCSKH